MTSTYPKKILKDVSQADTTTTGMTRKTTSSAMTKSATKKLASAPPDHPRNAMATREGER